MEASVEGVCCQVSSSKECDGVWEKGNPSSCSRPKGKNPETEKRGKDRPFFVDAILAKKNLGTNRDMAETYHCLRTGLCSWGRQQ